MHRDREERSDAPVVSLSVGDACTFRFGNPEAAGAHTPTSSCTPGTCSCSAGRAGSPTTASRASTRGRAPPGGPLAAGRLDLTLRVTGLPADAG